MRDTLRGGQDGAGGQAGTEPCPAEPPAGLDQVSLGQPSYVWRFGQERRLEMIRRHLPLEGARVLDIGCGLGAYVRRFTDFTDRAYGIDIDLARLKRGSEAGVRGLALAVSESLPFADGVFDGVLLNEVIEHVRDDRETLRESLRVTREGGKVVIFAPNRFYPFETHGIYVGKKYVFGNIPLVNYLPDTLRRRVVPHARAYTRAGLEALTRGLPARWAEWTVVYPGFDNIMARNKALGSIARGTTYRLESTWLRWFGLSHFLVLEKLAAVPA
ncbi:MAG TPA: class I SAM-dependent methyltransferase [Dehalococcoidia bacterium]|nr:class I SAM-dependent methyltransferase [Dehalococcoidia bacterium]